MLELRYFAKFATILCSIPVIAVAAWTPRVLSTNLVSSSSGTAGYNAFEFVCNDGEDVTFNITWTDQTDVSDGEMWVYIVDNKYGSLYYIGTNSTVSGSNMAHTVSSTNMPDAGVYHIDISNVDTGSTPNRYKSMGRGRLSINRSIITSYTNDAR